MSNQPEMTKVERIHAMAFDKVVTLNAELSFRNALLEAEVQVLKEEAIKQEHERAQSVMAEQEEPQEG